MWSHFHHGADIGVRGVGETLERAFEEAAVALTAVIAEPAGIRCLETVEVRCEAPDRELLLVDWLNAIVYEMAIRHMLFCRFKVELQGSLLLGSACGEAVDVARHQPAIEVKGATYTELEVREDRPGEWRAQCVVDV
ncbi:protein archease [Litchfieldella qijiaojingensis]|uniref:Protein archease n=1 Tax=Litchfieldella qijiaojingensis TaxID=980347 RepID=A0ABQ2Z678_9GAMM|nr:archease [Halomonas qijiaojingensis]GGY03030.1 protein archease [Halomonas qijiaojingensis]